MMSCVKHCCQGIKHLALLRDQQSLWSLQRLQGVEMAQFARLLVLLVILCSYVHSVQCVMPHDVELIPEEQKANDADKLGRSLSLGVVSGERHRRDHVNKNVEKELDIDLVASGSELLSPGFDVGYSELDRQVYGGEQKGEKYYQGLGAGNLRGEVGFYGNAGQKGSTGHLSEDAFTGGQQAAHENLANSGYYGNAAGAQQGYDIGKGYYGAQALNRKGLSTGGIGSKGGYRKGHHSSGFHNSYHKDESGNNTNYYDEAVDDGGHFFYGAHDGSFIDQNGNGFHGLIHDSAFRGNVNGNKGQHDAAVGYNNVQGHKGVYGRDGFYNNDEKYGQQSGGERYNKNAHVGQSEGGGAIQGQVGESYGHGIKQPVVVHGFVPQRVPVIYNRRNPSDYIYPTRTKNVHYPTYDYYPVGSNGPYSGDHYEKAIINEEHPLYDEIKGTGHATFVDYAPTSYASVAGIKEPIGYFGTYRGIAY